MLWLVVPLAVAGLLKPEPSAEKVRAKLETVEKGLAAIKAVSLEDLLAPMLAAVRTALKGSDAERRATLAKFPAWQKQMSARQAQVAGANDEERTSLLVAVLQNKADLPASEQLEVVNAPEFDGLPVVKYVNEHRDGKTPLVTLALQFLDGDAAPAPAAGSLEGIQQLLEGQASRAEAKLARLKADKAKLEKLFGKLNSTKPETKFLKRSEERRVAKEIAVEEKSEQALHQAVEDIKHKNVKGLQEAKQALEESMQAFSEQHGEFLHLLQLSTPGFSCPYCGAQCIEKCRTTEHKSMGACLKECIAKNPVGPA